MKKVTYEMVIYWLGNSKDEAVKILAEIANSYNDKIPYSPSILNDDINSTWKTIKNKKDKWSVK